MPATLSGPATSATATFYSDNTASNFELINADRGEIDAGEGNEGAGVSLSFNDDGSNGFIEIENHGEIAGRGQAAAGAATAGDGLRLEGDRGADGIPPGLFEGEIVNSGTITSESAVGATGAFRAVNDLSFQGTLINEASGLIDGVNNGVYFGIGDHSGGEVRNFGTIQSDSRAFNLDGDGLTVVNAGDIIGTGDQRNGTLYGDGSAEDYSITNTASGVIDAGEGNDGSGLALETGDDVGDVVSGTVVNDGLIQGRGDGETAATIGHGIRLNDGAGTDGDVSFDGSILNTGTIVGSQDSELAAGVSLEGIAFTGSFVNQGTIVGTTNAIDASTANGVRLANEGDIIGNVLLSDEDDVFVFSDLGSIDGVLNGADGFDTLVLDFDDVDEAEAFANSDMVTGFEQVVINGVTTAVSGTDDIFLF